MIDKLIDKFDTYGILPHTLPNAIGMWPNEQECLLWCALNVPTEYNRLEIGAFCGGSAILLALAKATTNSNTKVISIDNNFNPMFDHNVYQRGKFDNIVTKIECNSLDILQHYNEPLSFIFLDGWHSFSAIIKEFDLLEPLMTVDCIICFHDVSPKMCSNSNQTHIRNCYEFAMDNWDSLINSKEQDFRLDEAIATICTQSGYKIIDIPVRNNETHLQETGLTEWIRGKTSPFNSFTAIKRI